jgi:hypothetical protein
MLRQILILHACKKESSNSGDNEDYCVPVCDAVKSVIMYTISDKFFATS